MLDEINNIADEHAKREWPVMFNDVKEDFKKIMMKMTVFCKEKWLKGMDVLKSDIAESPWHILNMLIYIMGEVFGDDDFSPKLLMFLDKGELDVEKLIEILKNETDLDNNPTTDG